MALPIILNEMVTEDPGLVSFVATPGTDTDPIYAVDNVRDYRPYTRWKSSSSADSYLSGDWTGTNVVVDAWAVIGHNFATAGTDISMQVFEGTWVDAGSGTINATSDDEIIVGILPASKTDNAFRLAMLNNSVAPEVGVLLWGAKFEFPRYIQGNFDPQGQSIMAEQAISNSGEILGSTIRYREHNINAQFTRLVDTWVRNTFMPLWDSHLSQLKPFLWCWNPAAATLPDSQYVSITPGAQLQVPFDPMRQALTLNMRGRLRQ